VNLFTCISCGVQQSTAVTQTDVTANIQTVQWNQSEAIMSKPERGSQDISGADKASVLTVDQTEKQFQITGEMSNLGKKTSYTVLLAKSYTPKTDFPGTFTDKITAFPFTTSQDGASNWTFIVYNTDFPAPGKYTLSVWIQETASNTKVLASNNFDVTIK